MVQWLRLCAPNAGGLGSIRGQRTRSNMPPLKIAYATVQIEDPMCSNEDFGKPNNFFFFFLRRLLVAFCEMMLVKSLEPCFGLQGAFNQHSFYRNRSNSTRQITLNYQ